MKENGEREPGRTAIVNRIVGGLLLLCGLTAAVALDWRPMQSRDIADRVGPPRRLAGEPTPRLPDRIQVCETYTVHICGAWTLQPDGTYRAEWEDGATATIRVKDFSGTSIWASRVDDHPRGLTAEYSGSVTEGRAVVSGNVRWSVGRRSRAGSWSANWEPASGGGR